MSTTTDTNAAARPVSRRALVRLAGLGSLGAVLLSRAAAWRPAGVHEFMKRQCADLNKAASLNQAFYDGINEALQAAGGNS